MWTRCSYSDTIRSSLGAAKIIAKNKDKLNCNVRFIFQASEEGPESGAKYLVEDGVLDDVNYIFGLHVTNEIEIGKIGISIGNAMASANRFSLEIKGLGGHAGFPHLAVDSIAISSEIIMRIQKLVAREINPFEPIVVNIGTIKGGTISNAVAETVKFTGTVRTFSDETTEYLKKRIESIAKSSTQDNNGDYELIFNKGLPPLINKTKSAKIVENVIMDTIGKQNYLKLKEGKMGAEDFSYYLTKKPGTFVWLGTGNKEKGFTCANHNPRFDIDEDGLEIGVKLMKNIAMSYGKE